MRNYFFILLFPVFTSSVSAQNVNTNALHFDGIDDVVATASNISALNITGDITIEAWIKISSNTTDWSRIFGRGDNTNRTYGLWIGNPTYQNRLLWQIWGTGTLPNLQSATTLNLNTWYHVAVTRSTGGDAKMYINGALDCSSTGNTGTPHSTTFPIKIGYGDLHVYFPGTVDALRIWNVVRSPEQINLNKNVQFTTPQSGLVLNYNFNQGTANGTNTGITTVLDASGNSFNGTLSGFALTGSTSNWVTAGFTLLPVAWQSFTAKKQPTGVELNWSTASEQNTKDFEIQHSANTQHWTVLNTIGGAGNSSTSRVYSYIHLSPLKGGAYNYYRILQRDLDGRFSYSKIVSILYDEPGRDLMVYPNPASGVLTIFLADTQHIRILNMAGTTVWQGRLSAGRNLLTLDFLPKGVYMLHSQMGQKQIIID
ncbi:MAG: LamG-like jellyroll fold domain-containing protein [Bacteroidota bacterium]